MTSESLGWWSDIWALIAVWLTIGLAIAGALAWRFATWTSESKDAELKKYQADSAVKISEANAIAEKAKEGMEQAKLETEKIKERMSWRTIDPTLSSAISAKLALSSSGSIFITYVNGDPESMYLAIQIRNMFTAGGWKASVAGNVYRGIWFDVRVLDDPTNAPSISMVRNILSSAQIKGFSGPALPPISMSFGAMKPVGAVEIDIGTKRQPL